LLIAPKNLIDAIQDAAERLAQAWLDRSNSDLPEMTRVIFRSGRTSFNANVGSTLATASLKGSAVLTVSPLLRHCRAARRLRQME
jgi:hypothetical protein